MDTEQQVTIKLLFQESCRQLISTMVYAKCDSAARLELWDNGEWVDNLDDILLEVISFYQNQFSRESGGVDSNSLDHIPERISEDQNNFLCAKPTLEEVKNVVFALSADSACGPDGFSGVFYQSSFYEGQTLPKSVTHTNLVLLPKKEIINTFSDLRPISLSNFINKIISRQLHNKLEVILPSLISPNQSGFVKGRNIIENVLLTQELVADIIKRGKHANVIIKLDMAKAYDRLSWRFLVQVLRKMGFAEEYVDIVWRLIANNWYSILINGQSFGFFHSTRGVRQGDPLSPALFILTAEVLSMALNSLFEKDSFRGYGMPKWSTKLNHLSYADDTIIFASADKASLEMIVDNELNQEVQQITGFNKGDFPFTYLGCPIFHARRQKLFYKDMMKKVKDRLQAWRAKLLSFGGKVVLISSVLQSIPIYLMSAMVPPKCVIKDLHKLFNRFFWQTKEEGRRQAVHCGPISCGTNIVKGSDQLWFSGKGISDLEDDRKLEMKWNMVFGGNPRMDLLQSSLIIVLGDELEELMNESQWNYAKLQEVLPADIIDHVRMELGHFVRTNEIDKPWWMFTSSGKFTVKSAWEELRKRKQISTVKQTVLRWWNSQTATRLKPLYQAIPALVKWTFPDRRCFKCNTDGASKGNPGPSSAAFCSRDSSGEFIYAKRESSRVLHELLPVIVETDSLTMQKVLDGIWKVPWNIALPVRCIQRWRKDKDISVVHVFREGNSVADYFTNLVFDFAELDQQQNRLPTAIRTTAAQNINEGGEGDATGNNFVLWRIEVKEVEGAIRKMSRGRATGPDEIPVESWKNVDRGGLEWLTRLLNVIVKTSKMPEEWRWSTMVPLYKSKGDIQNCKNYKGIKLLCHTMKVWERVVEARMRKIVSISEN
ncbi:uncharacterized protein LOC132044521 [Lycium ferocissimum]|uniref:uncharacterized protein LOC132044521 n=1 Tax=Lycium ferocissimum TaxID=112874 RepID=UPI002815F00D|nr:uncharacterized protein LOC132044521 [Lycium ferocissimum]